MAKEKEEAASRRSFLSGMFKGSAYMGLSGLGLGFMAQQAKGGALVLRPPAAIAPKLFAKACTRCGQCVEACPYQTLKLATPGQEADSGTPYFNARSKPCYLCTGAPCVLACPSGALDKNALVSSIKPLDINKTRIGLAIIHKESCIAFSGIQCDACYRACPLMGEAIKLEYVKNTTTHKHANMQPVVNSDACTGCGMCEHACVIEKAAIMVLPLELATGQTGSHYVRSWMDKDNEKLKESTSVTDDDKDVKSALDYLNSDNPAEVN